MILKGKAGHVFINPHNVIAVGEPMQCFVGVSDALPEGIVMVRRVFCHGEVFFDVLDEDANMALINGFFEAVMRDFTRSVKQQGFGE